MAKEMTVSEMARLGGLSKSKRKSEAARSNGRQLKRKLGIAIKALEEIAWWTMPGTGPIGIGEVVRHLERIAREAHAQVKP